MKVMKSFVLAFGLLVSSMAQAENVDVIADARCGTWGDSLDQGAPTTGRVNFSLKCEKNAITKSLIRKHYKGTVNKTGTLTAGYPTYGYFDPEKDEFANPKTWFAPKEESAPCNAIEPGYTIAFFCASGCYAPEQEVLYANGYERIADARKKDLKAIMTLSNDSTLDNPTLKESTREKYITDAKAGQQTLLYFHMASGGELKITLNHPLIDREGKIRRADQFAEGDFLVKADGSLDAIKKIDTDEKYFGKVYNVSVDSQDPKEQIIVAQGYLNGSLFYQNEGVREVNRQLLRTSIAAHFIQ